MNNSNYAILFLGLFFTINFAACGQPPKNAANNRYLSRGEIESDFAQLTKIIETNVPVPFYNCSRAVYDSVKKGIASAIPGSAGVQDVYRIFYPLIQILNDAHFSIHLPNDFFSDTMRYFPFKVIIQGNKLFVKENLSTNSIRKRDEIIAINSIPVKEIIAKMRSCNFKSPGEELFFEKWNEGVFYKRLAALFNLNSWFDIELANGGHFKVQGVREALLKELLENNELSFKILEDTIGYLKIPSLAWNKQDDRKNFDNRIDSAFTFFQSKGVGNLIIDIRGNMGGSTILARDVLDYIYFKPYTLGQGEVYIENGVSKENNHASLHTPTAHSNCFKGKTILLNDVLTYSSAHMMQVGFQYYNMGHTIGEISSEPLFITGEVNTVFLKNSSLQFYYGTSNFILPGFKKDKKTFYTPNLTYTPTLTERLNGMDVILEKAKSSIAQGK
ncbi:hypothetical protein NIASO_04685 [Niabella soli DSM 19437]|uniref:Tail specific protease domain-containing protein n=2 Tax=Niabella TaxID=379899 RepID=W0F7D1_9BACT|nr:hypothetical protein NIASO_04685 [Niabella soli DSM 19437]